MQLIDRLRLLGLRQFTKRLLSALFRSRAYVLFSRDCEDAVMPEPLPGEAFHVLSAHNLIEKQTLLEALLSVSHENAEYVEDIRRHRILGFVIEFEQEVAHYGYLFLRNKTACILGIDSKTALIGNAFTVPGYRGKGAQPRSVRARAALARENGYRTILAETNPDNAASQRGMAKGGMQLVGRMDLFVVCSFLVARWRRPAGFPLIGFCARRG